VLKNDDGYPDFVIPLADAIANGTVERGIAVCGSEVGASIAANKVAGVRGWQKWQLLKTEIKII